MNDTLDKMNYRPVSVSPAVLKIFERIMQKQINNFVISFLSPYLCDCRKCFDTQQALLTLAQNWKKSIGNKDFDGAILMVFGTQKQPSRGVLKKHVLKICSKFTGEQPCRSFATLLKWHLCMSVLL